MKKKRKRFFDKKLNITPGTIFLDNVDKNIFKNTSFKNEINYFGSNLPGESEIKILKQLKLKNNYNNSLIVGCDSDLILCALSIF
jgi:5'-3' exonuclease